KLRGDVVVIGGGNVAADVARSAVRVTDGKVTMLCLESAEEMPAAEDPAEDDIDLTQEIPLAAEEDEENTEE
ncbi:MAG: hypothetical protein Q4D59_09770, partial [Erysipelotrichaceae bacterium]|nr:hypothetical protein [Erysipelotrichaceae bacterium]